MTYPATNLNEAVGLIVPDSNAFHNIINGDAASTAITPEGREVPTVLKAMADSLLFKDPIIWEAGGLEQDPLQLRTFTDGLIYWAPTAQLTNPVAMGASPIGDSNWKIAPLAVNNEGLIRVFDTVADMKAATWLQSGQLVVTKGYYTAGDGGQAEYLIQTSGEYGDIPDEYGDHLLENGNVAELIVGTDVDVKQFGAGSTDGNMVRVAVQNALYRGNIKFSDGEYFIDGGELDQTTGWRLHIVVPADRKIVFEKGATVKTSTSFANKAVLFCVRGSNVSIEGLDSYDENEAISTWIIPVGCGDVYDSGNPNEVLRELTVDYCNLKNAWLSVSVQYTAANDNRGFEDIIVSNCNSVAKVGNASSGNFNFRCDKMHKIKDVKVIRCDAKNGYSASSFNFYGVDGYTLAFSKSKYNRYAGHEAENGSQGGRIYDFKSDDDFIGLWVDDSRDIKVYGYKHSTTSETMTGLIGTKSRYREALLVTRQGFQEAPNWKTENITVSGMDSEFGRMVVSTFGQNPAGSFGVIKVNDFEIRGDGVARASGVKTILLGSQFSEVVLEDGKVIGAPEVSIEAGITEGAELHLTGIKTTTANGEPSTGLVTVGEGLLSMDRVDLHGATIGTKNTRRRFSIGGSPREDVHIGGQRDFYSVVGSPEGVLSAGPGSLARRVDDGAIYIKTVGIGAEGWKRVATE